MADVPETRHSEDRPARRHETIAFVLLSLVLFPVLSVIFVGGFGFIVWMRHLMFGPPGY